jgi:hypothetical protein
VPEAAATSRPPVREVINNGPVTSYGVNDMVLDNWGVVDNWTAYAPLTSYGRSGVGFVNFGAITTLRVQGPIETHGVGARGFNVYRLDGFAAARSTRWSSTRSSHTRMPRSGSRLASRSGG